MKNLLFSLLPFLLGPCICYAQVANPIAQSPSPTTDFPAVASENGLFDSNEVLQMTLRGSITKLLKNRSGKAQKFPVMLSYTRPDSSEVAFPVEVKTRGHFRRIKGNCKYPPLMIQFPNEGSHLSSVFKEQRKMKLVMPCKDDAYLIREWLVYELHNLVTPKSFRARLVKVSLINEDNQDDQASFYGILLEEEFQMANRNQMIPVERKLNPLQTQKADFLNMAVFQYLIGNTDWSVQYLQNIKLIAADSNSVASTIPYDFDHSGIVSAPYARPAEELKLKSTRERRYRGYCANSVERFEPIIEQYKLLKPDIYQIYTGCDLLDAKYVKSTVAFLDEFFETIEDPKSWQKEFAYPCDPEGTGNVVIKGLKED